MTKTTYVAGCFRCANWRVIGPRAIATSGHCVFELGARTHRNHVCDAFEALHGRHLPSRCGTDAANLKATLMEETLSVRKAPDEVETMIALCGLRGV